MRPITIIAAALAAFILPANATAAEERWKCDSMLGSGEASLTADPAAGTGTILLGRIRKDVDFEISGFNRIWSNGLKGKGYGPWNPWKPDHFMFIIQHNNAGGLVQRSPSDESVSGPMDQYWCRRIY